MKKLDLICYLFLMIGAVSCSNETTENLNEDLIIGTWKPFKKGVFADDGTPEVFEKTPCEQTSRFTYTEFEDDQSGSCVPDESFIIDGTWAKLVTGHYEFSFTYFNSNTQQSESDSQIPDKVTFSDGNTVMRVIEQVDEGEEYIELIRVN